jgi:hypothetical protein
MAAGGHACGTRVGIAGSTSGCLESSHSLPRQAGSRATYLALVVGGRSPGEASLAWARRPVPAGMGNPHRYTVP